MPIKLTHEIGKIYDTPRPCPKCGHTRAEFRTTATDYGAWWKCEKCGNVFGSYERLLQHGYAPLSLEGSNITTLFDRLRDLEKRVADLEAKTAT